MRTDRAGDVTGWLGFCGCFPDDSRRSCAESMAGVFKISETVFKISETVFKISETIFDVLKFGAHRGNQRGNQLLFIRYWHDFLLEMGLR